MKIKHFFIYPLLLTFFLISFNEIFAQSDAWQLHNEKDNVQIFYNYTECNIPSQGFYQELVLLRFKNNNNFPITIQWQLEAWYENKCSTCGLDEYKFELSIPANDGITGQCDIYTDSRLKIFSKFLNFDAPVYLEKFNISIISIKK